MDSRNMFLYCFYLFSYIFSLVRQTVQMFFLCYLILFHISHWLKRYSDQFINYYDIYVWFYFSMFVKCMINSPRSLYAIYVYCDMLFIVLMSSPIICYFSFFPISLFSHWFGNLLMLKDATFDWLIDWLIDWTSSV